VVCPGIVSKYLQRYVGDIGRLVVVMRRDFVSALRPVASCTIPGWKRMSPSERANRLGLTPNSTTGDFWRSRRWARKWEFFSILPCGTLLSVSSFTCRKILEHETFPLYFPSERVCWRIFISLKNPSPWPGSNLQTLGPVASTLTGWQNLYAIIKKSL
jgi:hypothetical protein